jgi:hypothetical protein
MKTAFPRPLLLFAWFQLVPASAIALRDMSLLLVETQKHAPSPCVRVVDAVLFTSESWAGGSGSLIAVAILVERAGKLVNLLPDVRVTNQSEYQIWNEPAISDTALVGTADYFWGEGEDHFGQHRSRISTYAFSKEVESYVLRDDYMTRRKYPGFDEAGTINVIAQEKSEIVSRLQRQQR